MQEQDMVTVGTAKVLTVHPAQEKVQESRNGVVASGRRVLLAKELHEANVGMVERRRTGSEAANGARTMKSWECTCRACGS